MVFNFFVSAPLAFADIEFWKVVEVTGPAEMKTSAESAWKNITAPFYLKRGSLVRTGKDASVDFCLSRQWDSFLRLNENSEMQIPAKSSSEARLQKGSLFALFERERVVEPFHIFSPELEITLSTGGLEVSVLESGTNLKVFSESIEVLERTNTTFLKSIPEGWEWTKEGTRRLDFVDYDPWQRWFRKNYDRKDKFFLKHSL